MKCIISTKYRLYVFKDIKMKNYVEKSLTNFSAFLTNPRISFRSIIFGFRHDFLEGWSASDPLPTYNIVPYPLKSI